MASQRMTKTIASDTADSIIFANFQKEEQILQQSLKACGDRVYDALYYVGEYESIFKNHAELFSMASSFRVEVPERSGSYSTAHIVMSTARPVIAPFQWSIPMFEWFTYFKQYRTLDDTIADSATLDVKRAWARVVTNTLTKSDPVVFTLMQSYKIAARRIDAMKARRNDLHERVYTALRGFATVQRAATEWPEIRSYLPACEGSAQPPAVQLGELNQLLNLGENNNGKENQ